MTIRLGREALDALGIEEDPYNADTFTHTFNIEVPVLDDYRYTLFSVSQGIEPYPVVHRNENGQWEALADEAAFIAWLKQTLSSEKTKRVLKTLSEQAAR